MFKHFWTDFTFAFTSKV